MTDSMLTAAVLALGLGVVVPWLGVRLMAPSLAAGPRVPNFRGRPVFAGLGVVWLLWAGAAILAGVAGSSVVPWDGTRIPVLALAGPLALVAFALGLFDDAYGDPAARGFRGHLSAMLRGRLTTGGAKLLGVSSASFVVALVLVRARFDRPPTPALIAGALAVGAAIALTSNFINLLDVRPGRALKAYSLLVACGVVSASIGLHPAGQRIAPDAVLADGLFLAAFAIGPVLATWRWDLGEVGMLGDAGANPAGAVAGLLIVAGLPVWGIGLYLVVMVVLNLASERISFTRIIESSTVLCRLDMLGRLPLDRDGSAEPASDSTRIPPPM